MPEVRVKLKYGEDIYIIPQSNPIEETIIKYSSENSYKGEVLVNLSVPRGVRVLRTRDVKKEGGLDKILRWYLKSNN